MNDLTIDQLSEIFSANSVAHFAPLDFSLCKPSVERLYKSAQEKGIKTAIMYLAPYYYPDEEKNISLYAVSEGYHLILSELAHGIISMLREKYPDAYFDSFADHSPILEVDACIKSGLGFIGENGLLISPAVGSFLFIGGIYTTLEIKAPTKQSSHNLPDACSGCGECRNACPVGLDKSRCLSYISQKKDLTRDEEQFLRDNNCIWGCDICQMVCPHNAKLDTTPIKAFHRNRTPVLTQELLGGMDKDAFERRGYAWRGRKTIERNIRIHHQSSKGINND